MITQIVCTRDIKVGAYAQPVSVATILIAIRSFQDAANDAKKDSDISRHPTDFDLYHLGSYNDETAEFNLFDKPQHIMNGGTQNV